MVREELCGALAFYGLPSGKTGPGYVAIGPSLFFPGAPRRSRTLIGLARPVLAIEGPTGAKSEPTHARRKDTELLCLKTSAVDLEGPAVFGDEDSCGGHRPPVRSSWRQRGACRG